MDVYFSNITVVYKSQLKTSSRFWKKESGNWGENGSNCFKENVGPCRNTGRTHGWEKSR